MNSCYLTDEEILILDGRCNSETQEKIDGVKRKIAFKNGSNGSLTSEQAKFLVDVLDEAIKNKKLVFRPTGLSECEVCKKKADYQKYKSGRNKGQPNYKKNRLMFSGVELAERFITWRGAAQVGCCNECWTTMQPAIKKMFEDNDVRAQIAEPIMGYKPKWKRYQNKKCIACGWEGHDGELKLLEALMGGKYPGECPVCGAKDLPLSFAKANIVVRDGYTVVAATDKDK